MNYRWVFKRRFTIAIASSIGLFVLGGVTSAYFQHRHDLKEMIKMAYDFARENT